MVGGYGLVATLELAGQDPVPEIHQNIKELPIGLVLMT